MMCQRREEVDRVVLQRRQVIPRRWVSSRQNGRYGVTGVGRHGTGVAKPVRLPRERGEIRIPAGIDVSFGSEQTVQRQLVKYDEHDWRSPLDRLHGGRRFRRQQTVFHTGIEEKQRRNDERGGRKRCEELANDVASGIGERHHHAGEAASSGVPGVHENVEPPEPGITTAADRSAPAQP